jgi:hypothetical protein
MITACMFGVRGVDMKLKNIFKRKILICCKRNGRADHNDTQET